MAVVDLLLGPDDGLELIKELKVLCPAMRILVVSMQPETLYAERVLRAGGDGFLQKIDAADHLLEAVDTVRMGKKYLSRASTLRIGGHLPRNSEKLTSGLEKLSDRELHVYFMVGAGNANKAIAEYLSLSPKTIETYKENIKGKLGFANTRELKQAASRWVESGCF